MIFPFLAVPAEPEDESQVTHYEDLEGAAPSNQYLTKKDAKKIGIGLLILAIIAWPLYRKMMDDRDRYLCNLNLHSISLSMGIYEANNDDRFPPTFVPDETGMPRVNGKGRPYVWASTLVNMAGFDAKRTFVCPAAKPEEIMIAEGEQGADLPMSFGMYQAYSAQRQASAPDPGTAVLIAESSNDGANETFDPKPIKEQNGQVQDGFSIGWASDSFTPPKDGAVSGSTVTRLAFEGSSKSGVVPSLHRGRHDASIWVMFADGHLALMDPRKLSASRYWVLPH